MDRIYVKGWVKKWQTLGRENHLSIGAEGVKWHFIECHAKLSVQGNKI